MASSKSLGIKIFACLILLIFLTGNFYTQTIWCPKGGIEGFEDLQKSGNKFITGYTPLPSEMKLFISTKGKQLYLQSNYKPKGAEYPFKLVTDEDITDLPALVKYLMNPQGTLDVDYEFMKAFSNDMTFYVEERVFADPKYRSLKFGNAENVNIIGADNVARPSRRLANGIESERIIALRPSIYARLGQDNPGTIIAALESHPFNKNDVRILPLTTNTDTIEKINEVIPGGNRIQFDMSSVEALREALSSHKDQIIFPLGHFENRSFLVRNERNEARFAVSLGQLESIAKEYNITIIPLGCNSAGTGRRGIANTFNTIHAVERFHNAIEAKNYADFFERLSSPNLLLVVDKQVLDGKKLRAEISVYEQKEWQGYAIEAATGAAGAIVISNFASNAAPDDNNGFPAWVIWVGAGCVVFVLFRKLRKSS